MTQISGRSTETCGIYKYQRAIFWWSGAPGHRMEVRPVTSPVFSTHALPLSSLPNVFFIWRCGSVRSCVSNAQLKHFAQHARFPRSADGRVLRSDGRGDTNCTICGSRFAVCSDRFCITGRPGDMTQSDSSDTMNKRLFISGRRVFMHVHL